MAFSFEQVQRASQIQTQRLNQQQIQSLKILAMSSQDLAKEIYSAVEKNPALEIVSDPLSDSSFKLKKSFDNTRVGKTSASGAEKSDAFQEALESKADTRESLQEHLLLQFNVMSLSSDEIDLGRRLIENLDKNGFHILAPISLLDSKRPHQNKKMLESVMQKIQNLDPVGVCCTNTEESLFIQAKSKLNAPFALLFILDGHFDFLNPPIISKIASKITLFVEENKKLKFNKINLKPIEAISEKDIECALTFIRTLDPFPARQYNSENASYIVPDVYVEKIISDEDVLGEKPNYRIRMANDNFPKIAISKEYEKLVKSVSEKEKKFAKESVKDAKVFLESLEYRNETIVKACKIIVNTQLPFFEKGPRYLLSLRQKDVAKKLGVHAATISRMANSKFIQCQWGLFAIKYFFTNGKEEIKNQIQNIIESHTQNQKNLSDKRISEILSLNGVKVARRTVAKYRSELNIDTSYIR